MNDFLLTSKLQQDGNSISVFMFGEILEIIVNSIQDFLLQTLCLSHGDTMTMYTSINLSGPLLSHP